MPPRYDPDEILGLIPTDAKVPFDPREVLARTVDGSDFGEYKPRYGTSRHASHGECHQPMSSRQWRKNSPKSSGQA